MFSTFVAREHRFPYFLHVEMLVLMFSEMIVHPLPHHPPHLELHFSFCGDFNWFQGLGILRNSWCLLFDFKDTEVAEFQAVALGELRDHLIEELLHYRLNP